MDTRTSTSTITAMRTTVERVIDDPREPLAGAGEGGATASFVRLLWLSSPALPIGAYAYSRGLEQAVTREWVRDEGSLRGWIDGVLRRQIATLDAPVMVRVLRAARAEDLVAVNDWNAFLLANRESRELSLEDAQLGASLMRLLRETGALSGAQQVPRPAHATAFGIAAAASGAHERAAAAAYLFAFVENQITAALKCMTLGQTAGQRILTTFIDRLEGLVSTVLELPDAGLGSFAPGLALASALHETQYTRLFRS